jgi:hypothetical protein
MGASIVMRFNEFVGIIAGRKVWDVNNSKDVFSEDLEKDYGKNSGPDDGFF